MCDSFRDSVKMCTSRRAQTLLLLTLKKKKKLHQDGRVFHISQHSIQTYVVCGAHRSVGFPMSHVSINKIFSIV